MLIVHDEFVFEIRSVDGDWLGLPDRESLSCSFHLGSILEVPETDAGRVACDGKILAPVCVCFFEFESHLHKK